MKAVSFVNKFESFSFLFFFLSVDLVWQLTWRKHGWLVLHCLLQCSHGCDKKPLQFSPSIGFIVGLTPTLIWLTRLCERRTVKQNVVSLQHTELTMKESLKGMVVFNFYTKVEDALLALMDFWDPICENITLLHAEKRYVKHYCSWPQILQILYKNLQSVKILTINGNTFFLLWTSIFWWKVMS